MFVTDAAYHFSTDSELLQDVSQFICCLNNKLISENVNFAKRIGFDVDPNAEYNAQLIEEINSYKSYDCWGIRPTILHKLFSTI